MNTIKWMLGLVGAAITAVLIIFRRGGNAPHAIAFPDESYTPPELEDKEDEELADMWGSL